MTTRAEMRALCEAAVFILGTEHTSAQDLQAVETALGLVVAYLESVIQHAGEGREGSAAQRTAVIDAVARFSEYRRWAFLSGHFASHASHRERLAAAAHALSGAIAALEEL